MIATKVVTHQFGVADGELIKNQSHRYRVGAAAEVEMQRYIHNYKFE